MKTALARREATEKSRQCHINRAKDLLQEIHIFRTRVAKTLPVRALETDEKREWTREFLVVAGKTPPSKRKKKKKKKKKREGKTEMTSRDVEASNIASRSLASRRPLCRVYKRTRTRERIRRRTCACFATRSRRLTGSTARGETLKEEEKRERC